MPQPQSQNVGQRRRAAVEASERYGDILSARPRNGSQAAPVAELRELQDFGLLTAPLPEAHGGLGLGTAGGSHAALLRILAAIGGGDLALGRLYEGHVNGLILIAAYGSPSQLRQAAVDAHAGRIFAVWNTGAAEPMRLVDQVDGLMLTGCKTFATGAAFVHRPIVTAERDGWQMTLPRMDTDAVSASVNIDPQSWHPLGMESSESYTVDFTGVRLEAEDLIGAPGDFYRDPLFLGGAIRFAAVQAGAVVRLYRMFADWLNEHERASDPYQIARLGEVALAAQEAVLWIERAAAVAEDCLFPAASPACRERASDSANRTRVAIERLATAAMPRIIAGVGARGLLRPAGFERILRDLTMYLRQPSPDRALADLGRSALRTREITLWRQGADDRG